MNAKVDSQAITARPMMKIAHPPHALTRAPALMASTIIPVFALLGSQALIAKPMSHRVTRNHVEMVGAVLTRMASILATVQLAGQEASVSRLWTGAKIIHVKMEEDVLSVEQAFTVIVQKAGLAKCVMFVVCLVKQQHA